MKKTVAIVHYNTPELTEAAILSLRKQTGTMYRVVVFDNSDKRPFEEYLASKPQGTLKGVTVIDNTQGQVIDFEKELAKYPDKCWDLAWRSNYGSAKHIMSVQKLWELIPDGFILMESDILLTRNINFLWDEQYAACGKAQWFRGRTREKDRLLPFLCYINVPLCVANGARYFDPKRCWSLSPGGMNNPANWYDTGASLLEDIIKTKPQLVARLYKDLDHYYVHYTGGSWRQSDIENQKAWLEEHRDLWEIDKVVESKDVAICAIVRNENRYLKEWVEHHLKLGVKKIFIYDNSHEGEEQPYKVLNNYMKTDAVEIIDYTNQGGSFNVQDKAYMDCYQAHRSEYAWIGFIDIDEMIEIQSRQKLPTILNKLQADVVVLSWRMMTDNGLTHYEDKPVFKRFTEPFKGRRYPDGIEFVKPFVRGGIGGLTFESQPHCPTKPMLNVVNVKGETVKQFPTMKPVYEVAWINHYHTKTAEEFVEKCRRGFPNGDRYTDDYRKNAINYFFAINERTKEKEKILAAM